MDFPFTKLSYRSSETVLGVLLILLLLALVVLLLSLPWIEWFRQELKYINTEIERNAENEREQNRWKRRKKRLLLSIIPGIKYE